MKRINITIIAGLAVLLLASCAGKKDAVDLSKIDLDLQIKRLDIEMYSAADKIRGNKEMTPMELYDQHFKEHRPFLLDLLYFGNDSVATDSLIAGDMFSWLSDPYVYDLLDTVRQTYPGSYDFESVLLPPFKRLRHYFPKQKIPVITTFVTGYDPMVTPETMDQLYFSPDGEYLGLGLHYYLGSDLPYYPREVPEYVRYTCQESHLPTTVLNKYAESIIPRINPISDAGKQPTLLDKMIRSGIKLYFLDCMLPDTPDSVKIAYKTDKMAWADAWEARIYKELIPHLYSTDVGIHRLYIDDAPFTKTLARESAPRIGQYCGWKIVRSYMEKNPDVELRQLVLETDYNELFKAAKYKPKE